MELSDLWRWVGRGALASVALVGAACGVAPRMGGTPADEPDYTFFGATRETPEQIRERQRTTNRGYNGTIVDLGSSIDPRTPERTGVLNRSLPADLAWQRMGQLLTPQGQGGSGSNLLEERPKPGDTRDMLMRSGGDLQRMEDGRGPALPADND